MHTFELWYYFCAFLIYVREELTITLSFNPTWDNLHTIAAEYCFGHSISCQIVVETEKAIYQKLATEFLKVPDEAEWRQIVIEFSKMWHFPNYVGAIEKHTAMQAPSNSGFEYFNYTHFTINLFHYKQQYNIDGCDTNYKCTTIHLDVNGREDDRKVYNSSLISKLINSGKLGLLLVAKLPYYNIYLPHVIVGVCVFPLISFMMNPYPGRWTGIFFLTWRAYSWSEARHSLQLINFCCEDRNFRRRLNVSRTEHD